jgi:hypothetical protein
MAGLFLVNCLDVARSLGDSIRAATPEQVCEFLTSEYLKERQGGFNHDPAISATYDMFSGLKDVLEAEAFCLQNGNPKGREQNAEIVRTVGSYACSRISRCHKHGFLAVTVGRYKGQSIHVGLKAPFTRVRDGKAFVVVPGFRKSFVPSEQQIDVPCSLASVQLARDDFRGADVEYLYAGPSPAGEGRMFRVIHGESRNLLDADELDEVLETYVRGVVMTLERGRGLSKPDLAGYRVVDPDEPSLFEF